MFLQKCAGSESLRRGRARMNRRYSPPTTGYGGSRKPWTARAGAGNTDEDLAVIEGRCGVEPGSVVFTAGAARARGKARRAGDRQQRLQERSEAAQGGKRRPDHGRHPQATRFFGDGCGEPDAAGFQPDPAGIRQRH